MPANVEFPSKIGIIGVGYVGLPLATAFAAHFDVVGFDISKQRVAELNEGIDRTLEVPAIELQQSNLVFSSDPKSLDGVKFLIVTVPTPVDQFNTPDLSPLYSACETVGKYLKKGSIVVFESTVYPGLSEQILAPRLEKISGLKYNQDFFLGYSPERINPGDREHTIRKVVKIVSGSTPEVLETVARVYETIVIAGVHRAPNIATAEAAKVIENIQRDVNIGLINELTVLFSKMDLDIYEVLAASSTKWNFMPFRPGLVGGHCIGVDPFYLTHKAQQVGYHPELIIAGRRINDSMASFFASRCLAEMLKRKISPIEAKVLVLGLTFKENCPDVRNTKVADLVKELRRANVAVDIIDPIADPEAAKHEYGLTFEKKVTFEIKYDAVILAVPHTEIMDLLKTRMNRLVKPNGFILDIKGVFPRSELIIHC